MLLRIVVKQFLLILWVLLKVFIINDKKTIKPGALSPHNVAISQLNYFSKVQKMLKCEKNVFPHACLQLVNNFPNSSSLAGF
jgi:hypothetical protein